MFLLRYLIKYFTSRQMLLFLVVRGIKKKNRENSGNIDIPQQIDIILSNTKECPDETSQPIAIATVTLSNMSKNMISHHEHSYRCCEPVQYCRRVNRSNGKAKKNQYER